MKVNVKLTVAAKGRVLTQSTLASIARLRTISGGTICSRVGCKLQQRLQLVFLTQLRAQLSSRQPNVWPDNNHLLSYLAGLNRD